MCAVHQKFVLCPQAEHVGTIEKKLAEAIDEHGWLHSGDKGAKDERGMFKITGRYKEIIIGAGGENIAPVPLEDNIKRLHPGISNVLMVGDKRKFNVALITLKAEGTAGLCVFFPCRHAVCKTHSCVQCSGCTREPLSARAPLRCAPRYFSRGSLL